MMKFKSLLFCLVVCAIIESSLGNPIADDDDEYDYNNYDYDYDYGDEDSDDGGVVVRTESHYFKRAVPGGQPIPNNANAEQRFAPRLRPGQINNGRQHNNQKRAMKFRHRHKRAIMKFRN